MLTRLALTLLLSPMWDHLTIGSKTTFKFPTFAYSINNASYFCVCSRLDSFYSRKTHILVICGFRKLFRNKYIFYNKSYFDGVKKFIKIIYIHMITIDRSLFIPHSVIQKKKIATKKRMIKRRGPKSVPGWGLMMVQGCDWDARSATWKSLILTILLFNVLKSSNGGNLCVSGQITTSDMFCYKLIWA